MSKVQKNYYFMCQLMILKKFQAVQLLIGLIRKYWIYFLCRSSFARTSMQSKELQLAKMKFSCDRGMKYHLNQLAFRVSLEVSFLGT